MGRRLITAFSLLTGVASIAAAMAGTFFTAGQFYLVEFGKWGVGIGDGIISPAYKYRTLVNVPFWAMALVLALPSLTQAAIVCRRRQKRRARGFEVLAPSDKSVSQ